MTQHSTQIRYAGVAKSRTLPIINGVVLLLVVSSCVPTPESAVESRIARVEAGLRRTYGAPPWTTMMLEARMAYHQVPGVSIAVVNDFKIEWVRGYGVMESGSTNRVTPDTLFQAASTAKPVVAAAALHLVEQGLLELDVDVNQSLTSWRVPENEFTTEDKVTLRRLLSHSAGVTVSGFRGYPQGEETPDLRQILNGEPPANSPPIRVDAVPGSLHRYSGGGYMIVQQLLEDVAGKSFAQIMREVVLTPWGMTVSTFESPLPAHLHASAASGHRADGTVIAGRWHTYPEAGAGASPWSTPSDMARFAIGLMLSYTGRSDDVLSQGMAIQMLTPQIADRGLGPVIQDDGGDLLYFMHPGANEGYRCVLIAYPKRGQGVVIMTNADGGEAIWYEILRSVSVEYGWVKDRTYLYAGIAAAIVLSLLAIVVLRLKRMTLGRSRPDE